MTEIRRSLTQAKGFGFEAYEMIAEGGEGRFPWMSLDGIVGAAWIPSDGYIDPYALTMAFVKGCARRRRHDPRRRARHGLRD